MDYKKLEIEIDMMHNRICQALAAPDTHPPAVPIERKTAVCQ